jgi:hypothetical protein
MRRSIGFLAIAGSLTLLGVATAAPGRRPGVAHSSRARDATAGDFDFLVGSFELAAENTAPVLPPAYEGHRKYGGRWVGVKIGDGSIIEDDYRVVDPAGRTRFLGITFSSFDPNAKKWNLAFTIAGSGKWQWQVAEPDDSDMILKGADSLAHRARFYSISTVGFAWRQEDSNDGGVTWAPGAVRAEARRLGATGSANR